MPAPALTPPTILTIAIAVIVLVSGAQWASISNLREDVIRDLGTMKNYVDALEQRQKVQHQAIKDASISHANNNRAGMFTNEMFNSAISIRDDSLSDLWSAANQCQSERAQLSAVMDQFDKWLNILARKQDNISENLLPDLRGSVASTIRRISDIEDDVTEVASKQDEVRESLIPALAQRLERIEGHMRQHDSKRGSPPHAHYSANNSTERGKR